VPDFKLDRYLLNGYQSIWFSLVQRVLKAGSSYRRPINASGSEVGSAKVLVIDEINRGNISRIFGELITLIEPSKRAGASDALSATLPYSKTVFSVPENVYLIGTMNTADRSLTGLDIALRRRFTFKEMPPRADLLEDIDIEGVNVGHILRAMNERIEVLLDRDRCLGHAYFLPLQVSPTLLDMATIFRQQIIPLLQEYFFEDWERISWVLNDHSKNTLTHRFIVKAPKPLAMLFGAKIGEQLQDNRWIVNEEAFELVASFAEIIEVAA
jgi:5-methylcytosine-specific restriction protein B